MSQASQSGVKIAFAVLFVLRSLWFPAHLALEPHDHSPTGRGSGLQSETSDHGNLHRHGGSVHVHDQGARAKSTDEGGDERAPHPRHPATDHKLDPMSPQVRSALSPEPVTIVSAAWAVNLDLGLRRDPSRTTASAPGGRSPPPRPPTRAPPLA